MSKRRRRRKKVVGVVAKPQRAKKPKRHEREKPVNPKPLFIKGPPGFIAQRLMNTMLARNNKGVPFVDESKVDDSTKDRVLTRFEMKRYVSRTLGESGDARDTCSLAKYMPVYSESTRKKYERVWKMFFTHLSENYAVKDVRDVKRLHVEDFLKEAIDRGVSLRTYKTYSAAISKLEPALNKARKYPIAYSKTVHKMNKSASSGLVQNDPKRAYVDPERAIARIEDSVYKLAALLQYEGGARIAEVSELKAERNLRGIRDGYGHIHLTNTKGGRQRTMKVPVDTYKEVREIIKKDGVFRYQHYEYSQAAAKAFSDCGEEWNGTHGLRWNFAQRRFGELKRDGALTHDEALKIVSFELGHSRPSITLHYLQ